MSSRSLEPSCIGRRSTINDRRFPFRRRLIAVIALATLSSMVPIGVASAQTVHDASGAVTGATLASEQGDWVAVSGAYSQITIGYDWLIQLQSGQNNVNAVFSAPNGKLLTDGTYNNTVRTPTPTNGSPVMSISGDGHGCNTEHGSFTIHDIAYGTNESIKRLAVEFDDVCGDDPPAATYGSITINSAAVMPALNIHPGSSLNINDNEGLPPATVGVPYVARLFIFGGNPSYSVSLFSGKLPPGLYFHSVSGDVNEEMISGTPKQTTTVGYPFVIQVLDQSRPTLYPSRVTAVLPDSIIVRQPSA